MQHFPNGCPVGDAVSSESLLNSSDDCATPQDNFHGRYKDSEYEMSNFWATNFTANLFGVANPDYTTSIQGRSSLEVEQSALPLFARACSYCAATASGQGHTF